MTERCRNFAAAVRTAVFASQHGQRRRVKMKSKAVSNRCLNSLMMATNSLPKMTYHKGDATATASDDNNDDLVVG